MMDGGLRINKKLGAFVILHDHQILRNQPCPRGRECACGNFVFPAPLSPANASTFPAATHADACNTTNPSWNSNLGASART